MGALIDFLSEILQWFMDLLLWVPRKLWELCLDGLAGFIEWLPVPSFMTDLGDFLADVPPSVAYFGSSLQIGTGISMVLAAWAIRFVIRRIPVIG